MKTRREALRCLLCAGPVIAGAKVAVPDSAIDGMRTGGSFVVPRGIGGSGNGGLGGADGLPRDVVVKFIASLNEAVRDCYLLRVDRS
jgi:hypothetical protein